MPAVNKQTSAFCIYFQSVPVNKFGFCCKYDRYISDTKPCTNQGLSIFCQLFAEYPQTQGDIQNVSVILISCRGSLPFGFLHLSFSHPFILPLPFDLFFSPSVFSSFCKLLSLTSVDSSCFPIASSHFELRHGPRLLSFPLHAHGLWRTLGFYSELVPTARSFSVFTWSLREIEPTQRESIMSK